MRPFEREMALIDDHFADRRVRMAIATGIDEAGGSTLRRDQAGRSLHMHEEKVDAVT